MKYVGRAYKWRLGVSERVIRIRWLVALDRRRSQAASSLVLYYNGVVSVHLRVLRFGGHWCPVNRYGVARQSVPLVCARRGPW